uniref:Uncharacterized protein n=1 Tax=Arundo donax TaxID=35708 RepID=A0A0A8ZP46_ARUDO
MFQLAAGKFISTLNLLKLTGKYNGSYCDRAACMQCKICECSLSLPTI